MVCKLVEYLKGPLWFTFQCFQDIRKEKPKSKYSLIILRSTNKEIFANFSVATE